MHFADFINESSCDYADKVIDADSDARVKAADSSHDLEVNIGL